MDETQTFLHHIFASKPEGAAVQIWLRSKQNITWTLTDLGQLASLAELHREHTDVYIACGLAARAHETAQRTRLKADEIAGIPGVWADIDVNGGPDSKEGAAPDLDSAISLASELLEPTALVKSGYGLQAWWCFEEVWMFATLAEREQAKRIVSGFQGALRAAARRLGWGLDATQDLSRVLRLPGTLNHKNPSQPAPVALAACEGARYSVEEVAELGQGFSIAHDTGSEKVDVAVRQGVALDPRLVELLQEPDFVRSWECKRGPGRPRDGVDNSLSAYEMSITNWLVLAGLDDQAICDVLHHWRLAQEPGDPRGKCRASRFARTIARVRATRGREADEEAAEAEQQSAEEHLERMVTGKEEPNEAKTMSMLNRIIGGPEIARVRQYSRDPEVANFVIELGDGREVALGDFDSLANQAMFRRKYAVITGHYPKTVKAGRWDLAIAAMLKEAHIEDQTEESSIGNLMEMLDDYFEGAGHDQDAACQAHQPFTSGGSAYLSLHAFGSWLASVGQRYTGMSTKLKLLGFSRTKINYVQDDGVRSSRSYFVAPLPLRLAEVTSLT